MQKKLLIPILAVLVLIDYTGGAGLREQGYIAG